MSYRADVARYYKEEQKADRRYQQLNKYVVDPMMEHYVAPKIMDALKKKQKGNTEKGLLKGEIEKAIPKPDVSDAPKFFDKQGRYNVPEGMNPYRASNAIDAPIEAQEAMAVAEEGGGLLTGATMSQTGGDLVAGSITNKPELFGKGVTFAGDTLAKVKGFGEVGAGLSKAGASISGASAKVGTAISTALAGMGPMGWIGLGLVGLTAGAGYLANRGGDYQRGSGPRYGA